MLRFFRRMLWLIVRFVLSLRYRVRVHGTEQLGEFKGPLLILPNHPGFVDPMLMLSLLGPRLHPRPMLAESNFQSPVMRLLMKLLNALRVPDLDQASSDARDRAQQAVAHGPPATSFKPCRGPRCSWFAPAAFGAALSLTHSPASALK
jgi:long-chain-fatty-acid--[acyl-carrier-protein] ligase